MKGNKILSIWQALPFSSLKSLRVLLASSLFSFVCEVRLLSFSNNFGVCNRYPFGLQYVAQYSVGTSIRTLKTRTQFLRRPFQFSVNEVFRMKAEHFSFKRWKFWRFESLRNSRGRRRSVQVSKLFMANIYAVSRAVKLVLLRKGRVMCDIFKETVLFLKLDTKGSQVFRKFINSSWNSICLE